STGSGLPLQPPGTDREPHHRRHPRGGAHPELPWVSMPLECRQRPVSVAIDATPTWSTPAELPALGTPTVPREQPQHGGHPNRPPGGTLVRRTPPSPARSEVAMGAVGCGEA